MLGGKNGAPSQISFSDGSVPHQKSRTQIGPGIRLHMRYAGGGGYGDPAERATTQIQEDIKNGYVTAAAARRDYGRS